MKNGKFRVLVINPGSTSTKVSLFEDETSVFEQSLFHEASVLLGFPHVNDQAPFRRGVILDMLKAQDVDPSTLDAFVGRGGSAHTHPSGLHASTSDSTTTPSPRSADRSIPRSSA